MLKRCLHSIMVMMICLGCLVPGVTTAYAAPDVPSLSADKLDAETAVLMDAHTGVVLFEKNGQKRMFPASTTKAMTALLAVEFGDFESTVTATKEVYNLEANSTHIGLKDGEKMNFRDMLYGLMLNSGNDAAIALGIHVAGSLPAFIDMMNQKAEELGCKDTHFMNPHGLHDAEHYTTAQDLANIARAGLQLPELRKIVSTFKHTIPKTNMMDEPRYLVNSNKLISQNKGEPFYYEYATGFKTGYTSKAKHAYIASAEKDGMELIAVVMGDTKEGKWKDATRMLEWGFGTFESAPVITDDQKVLAEVPVANGQPVDGAIPMLSLVVGNYEDKGVLMRIGETPVFEVQTEMTSAAVTAPVQKGQVLGQVTYTYNGQAVLQADLIAAQSITPVTTILPTQSATSAPNRTDDSDDLPGIPWSQVVVYAVIALLSVSILACIIMLVRKTLSGRPDERIHTNRTSRQQPRNTRRYARPAPPKRKPTTRRR